MKAVACIVLSSLLLLSACSPDRTYTLPSVGALPQHSREAYAAEQTPTPEPEFTIAAIKALEDDEFAYVREAKDLKSKIIGAVTKDTRLAVTEKSDEWCRVIYGRNAGYIRTERVEILPQKDVLPRHEIYFIAPRMKDIKLVETKFDNMLDVKNTQHVAMGTLRDSLYIYTATKLLARDATLEITDGVITAPAVSGQPVKIVIEGGVVTTCEGVALSKDTTFDPGSDMGSVIAADMTVIEYAGRFFEDAEVKVTSGTIYGIEGEIAIKPDYYFKPHSLEDNLLDVALYTDGIEIDMLFAKDGNLLGDRIYDEEVCLLQKSTLEKLARAALRFKEDGYTLVIYDAYRPYSVTVELYRKYHNKYVAPLKFGSNHNRGAAVDMSLLDSSGTPIEMPSPIHTLNSTSNRNNKSMSTKARANMDYMTDIMVDCGFKTIDTEWWHFVDTDNAKYLRTDYDLNSLLRVICD